MWGCRGIGGYVLRWDKSCFGFRNLGVRQYHSGISFRCGGRVYVWSVRALVLEDHQSQHQFSHAYVPIPVGRMIGRLMGRPVYEWAGSSDWPDSE